jgi:hypothetical protein
MKFIMMVILLLSSIPSFAEEKITLFVTLSPAGSFQAVSKKAKGNVIKENGIFTADKISVSIESFKTGIDLRDEHLWKHMQSIKHPKATLSELKAKDGKGTASLEINGIKKAFNLTFAEKGQEVEAKFKLKASDFALPKAEYLGVGVEDIVSVEVTLPFKAR